LKNPASNRVFGPFWGEFGWEVAQWAPYVNYRAQETDRILCMPGHADLYAFDGPISQSSPRPSGAVPDMLGCSGERKSIGILHRVRPESLKVKLVNGVPCIDAEIKPVPLYPACAAPRRFVVLHCRAINKCAERNLMPARWDRIAANLIENGAEVAVIGSELDYCPQLNDQGYDLRGASLDDTISFLRTARVVVGASSGPMHLAQACEAPVVVWSGNAQKDRPRYKAVWNHFDSPTTFVASTWQPGVNKVLQAIEDSL
jgi:hypothetical protein